MSWEGQMDYMANALGLCWVSEDLDAIADLSAIVQMCALGSESGNSWFPFQLWN